MLSKGSCLFLLIAAAAQMPLCFSFPSPSSSNNIDLCQQRRTFLERPLIFTVGTILSTTLDNKKALAADGQLAVLLDQIKEGSKQLEAVPDLIKAEQWDAGM